MEEIEEIEEDKRVKLNAKRRESYLLNKCIHGRRKNDCKQCGGSQICIHMKKRSYCRDCGGNQICSHGRRKARCVECGGSAICIHGNRKTECKTCNLNIYLVNSQRSRLKRFLKRQNLKKTKLTIEHLGCSPKYFKEYMQRKMVGEMNFGNINLDHIKPVKKFDLTDLDELKKCCHYTNMQPLLVSDNLIKASKWSDEDEIFWNENIIYKEYLNLYMPKN